MKSKLFIAMVAIATLSFVSCEKEEKISQESINENIDFKTIPITVEDSEKIEYLIKEMGFSKEDIRVTESRIIVENDISFNRQKFWELYGPQKQDGNLNNKSHYKQIYLVTKVTNITIVVGTSASSWLTAIQEAANAWNSLNGKLSFSVISSNQPTSNGINIARTSFGSGNSNIIAQGDYVTSTGYPGPTIYINSDAGTLTSSQKKMAMVHEIGHCIGFYHTDGYVGTLITNVVYTCHASPDLTSVMRPNVTSWYGFSPCDKAAFLALYPK